MRRPVGTSAIWFLVGVVVGAAGSALVLGAIYYLSFSRPSTPAATHPSTPSVTHLSISNGTTITVVLAVNGTVIETIGRGGYQDPSRHPCRRCRGRSRRERRPGACYRG